MCSSTELRELIEKSIESDGEMDGLERNFFSRTGLTYCIIVYSMVGEKKTPFFPSRLQMLQP